MTELSRRLLEARRSRGLARSRLGASVGVTGQTIYRWETGGAAAMKARTLARLAGVLGVSSDWLLGLDDVDLDDTPEAA